MSSPWNLGDDYPGHSSPVATSPLLRPGPVYGGQFCDFIVTICVGPERTPFRVHQKLLTRSCKFFDAALCGSFKEGINGIAHLKEDDPDAFGLLLTWLYRGRLPFFNPAILTKAPRVSELPKDNTASGVIKLPSTFTTPREWQEGGVLVPSHIRSIFALEMYISLSPEELQLLEGPHVIGKELVAGYAKYLQQPVETDTKRGGRKKRDPDQKSTPIKGARLALQGGSGNLDVAQGDPAILLRYLVEGERIPVHSQFGLYVQAEYLQLTLVKLLVMAEKYGWDDLFNDAMDAFREGERYLARRHPLSRHLELAYTGCHPHSPLLVFFADYAFWAGKYHNTLTELLEVAVGLPDLLSDLCKRLDGRVAAPGGGQGVFDLPVGWREGPLAGESRNYHLHGLMSEFERRGTGCPPECLMRRQRIEDQGLMLRG
jgi:hypothetical protein